MAINSAVDASAVARVLGVATNYRNLRGNSIVFLPQRIAVVGQGTTAAVYSTDKQQVTSAVQAGQLYGFGSPIHLAVQQLLPNNGDGVGTIPVTVYPLDDDGAAQTAAGDITPSAAATGSAAFRVVANGVESVQFIVSDTDTVATITAAITTAVNNTLDMPIVATDNTTDVGVAAKWAGASGNDISVSVVATSEDNSGITFALTQPTGGLANPDVQLALDKIGDVWETMILNCMDIADTATLDTFANFGQGRWGALTRKPLVVFTGNTESDASTAIATTDARPNDYFNCQLTAPGSPNLPFVVAARQLARIAPVANNNPARDYGSQQAAGLTPGADGEQWDYLQRDTVVKGGSSTSIVRDGVVTLQDTVTMYHPNGDPTPAYRYVCDIVKLMNIIFNVSLQFENPEWDGAPLIPDDQPTINPDAKRPKDAVAAMASLIDGFGLNAIISDTDFAKENTFAMINDQNPKRLDLNTTVKLSGNSNIISVGLDFGFFFGTAPVAA